MNVFSIISKAYDCSEDFNTFTAIIMEPENVDLHGDITSEEEIKKACHNFMKKRGLNTGVQHIKISDQLAIVQCFVTDEPKKLGDREIKKGSWLGVFEPLNENLKKQIRDGEFKGVSIAGIAATKNIENHIQKSIENPYKDSPKRRLSNIDVDEISIVDQPANNQYIVSFQKNLGAGVKINIEDIKKAVEENKELLEQIKKEYAEKPKEPEAPKTIDDIYKSLSPELATIFKAQQDKVIELEKAQNEVIKKQFVNKVTEIKKYAKVDDGLSDALMAISKSNPEHYKLIDKALNTTIDTIKKGDFFNPVGADNPEDNTTNTHESKVENIAKRLIKENPNLTKEQAIAKIYKENIEE